MRVVIAGGHGKIARLLGGLLVARGDEAVGLVRSAGHVDELRAAGQEAALLDLERASVDDVADALAGADVAVFAAGAGPGSGAPRKDTVDRAASVLLADAAERAGVRRFLQVSAMGLDRVRERRSSRGGDVFEAYLRAKAAAEDDLRARPALDATIVRPGALTDDPGTGSVTLAASVPYGSVPRADVAAVLLALCDEPATSGATLELVTGSVPISEAIAALRSRGG